MAGTTVSAYVSTDGLLEKVANEGGEWANSDREASLLLVAQLHDQCVVKNDQGIRRLEYRRSRKEAAFIQLAVRYFPNCVETKRPP